MGAGFVLSLSTLGATLGTLYDAIHSNSSLQTYHEPFAVNVLGLIKTSLVVPPLLSVFYLVIGSLYFLADQVLKESLVSPSLRMVVFGFILLALEIKLSAYLYETNVPFPVISGILFTAFAFNWVAFDRTKQGLAVSITCGLVAPIAELLLMKAIQISYHTDPLPLPLWSYEQADLFLFEGLDGFVSWVPLCYTFYTPILVSPASF